MIFMCTQTNILMICVFLNRQIFLLQAYTIDPQAGTSFLGTVFRLTRDCLDYLHENKPPLIVTSPNQVQPFLHF